MPLLEKELRTFIVDNFLFGERGNRLRDEDSFLDHGIIDSTGVMELVGYLEQQYKIQIQDEELIPDNLDSIGRLGRFIRRKRNGAGGE